MKKWLSLAVVVWSLGRILLADTAVVDGYVWTYEGQVYWDGESYEEKWEGKILGVSPKPTGALTIPSQLDGCKVTAIGKEAFRNCMGLENVVIPDGVEEIGEGAFAGCTNLASVAIPDGVTCVGDRAFMGCSGLKDTVIPSSVTSIGTSAFSNCTGLKRLTVPSSVKRIGTESFSGCTGLTNVTLPSGIWSIGTGIFSGCTGLTSVTIPSSVEKIGDEAFSGCTSLTSVTIPSSVEEIGDEAFQGCSSLTSVTIPSSVEWIGTRAFSDCPNLTEGLVVDPENVFYISWNGLLIEEYDYDSGDGEVDSGLNNFYTTLVRGVNGVVEIPFGVTKIGVGAFSGCSGLTDVMIPSSVELIDERAFEGCIGLAGVTVPSSVEYVGERAFQGCVNLTSVAVPASVVSCDDDRDGGGLERVFDTSCITNVVILDGVREIGRGMFSKCFCLTDVSIPLSVGRIGEGAFSGCVGLTDVTIPPGVRFIQKDTFLNCRGLTNVVIPSSVVCIEEGAFSGCSSLASATIPSNVRYLGTSDSKDYESYELGRDCNCSSGRAFEGCSRILNFVVDSANKFYSSRNGLLLTKDGTMLVQGVNGDVVIPSGVTRIADSAFSGFSGLTSVSIPSSVKEIGDEAFRGCTGLTSVTIPANVTEIGYRAFLGCSGLTNFTVDAANESYVSRNELLLTKDGSVLIRGVNGDVVIPPGVREIGDGAFLDCAGLTSVAIPDGVTRIGDGAFSGCIGLVNVDIPGSVMEIGSETFSGCTSLTGVTIPDGVTHIGDGAFSGCSGLVNVDIPGSVTEIGDGAFSGCRRLADIAVDPANASYAIRDGMLVTKDGRRLVCGFRGDIVIPEDMTGVDFMDLGCDGLTSVTIPANVRDVANYGGNESREWWWPRRDRCSGYRGLTNIMVSAENEVYFSRNGLLLTGGENWRWRDFRNTDVVLVQVLVQGVNGDVVIPEGVTGIAGGSFSGCMGLTSVAIPSSVTRIDSDSKYQDDYHSFSYFGAFYGCGGLTNITVDAANRDYSSRNGLLLTGNGTVLVRGVNGNVMVPPCVRRIGEGAFSGCAGLTGVVIPSGVMGIGERAFEDCGGLTSVTLPPSVVAIGESAFEGCTSLARVRLPRRFEGRLGPNVFAGCGEGLVLDYYDEVPRSSYEVAVVYDAVGGTVTGGGTYAAGKKVVLKATARKGYVFAGWELEGAALSEGVDLQNPSLTLVAGGVDMMARARFIPVSDDWAEVGVAEGSASFAEEYATGGAFAPVTLAARGGSRAALKVSGLPAGLKFTAKALKVKATKTSPAASYPANTVYGTPTRSGVYTVAATATTAGGKTATARWTFAVRKPGERIARTACDAAHGTVTGGGTYAAGKKVVLKATAKKGYVFAGWELEGADLPEGTDPRNPSLALVAGDADVTARARFIPVEEDWAEVSGTLPAECAKGAAIRPATLAARGGSLVAVKVTGLPAGLKFTAKPLTVKATKTAPAASYPANTVYGTPTRSGVYTVAATATTAGRATAATNWTVVVRGPGERVVRTACDAAHGKVSGAGVYAKGKKATLKATAGKGFAFAGWELEGVDLPAGADARDPSLALAVGESDVTARARFVPAGEDGALALLVDGAEVPEDGSARFRDAGAGFALEAVSASLPKVALSGLPPGLKYDAKAGRIAGRGTKPGLYTVTAKLSNATVRRAVARTFRIEVPNLRDADALLRDGLANAPGEAYRAYVGVRAAGLPSLVPADPAHAKSLKVSSLPAGLKFDAKAVAAGEAALAGVPSKAGAYTVSVAVAGKTSTFTLEVLPLPDWAVGTFTGCFDETGADGTALRGTAAFTVSAAGKVSAKLVRQDGKAASWTHACLDRAETDAAGGVSFRVDAVVGGFRCEVSISAAAREGGPAQGVLAGTRRPVDAEDAGEGAVGLAFDCVQNLWGRGKALEGLAAKLKGRKVALPTIRDEQGNTYDVSLAFRAGGAVTAKYRLNGGAAQSASGTLAYRGAGELEAGGGDGEDGEGKTEQVSGSSVSLYLNLVRGGRVFLEAGLLVDGEGVVHWVDGRVAGDGEP